MIKLWKNSRQDSSGWAYESEVAQTFIKAFTSLAYELNIRKNTSTYEKFFNEVTDKVKDLLNDAPRQNLNPFMDK